MLGPNIGNRSLSDKLYASDDDASVNELHTTTWTTLFDISGYFDTFCLGQKECFLN